MKRSGSTSPEREALLKARADLTHQIGVLRSGAMGGVYSDGRQEGELIAQLEDALGEAERELTEMDGGAPPPPIVPAEAAAAEEDTAPASRGVQEANLGMAPQPRPWRPPLWPTLVGLLMLAAVGWFIVSHR